VNLCQEGIEQMQGCTEDRDFAGSFVKLFQVGIEHMLIQVDIGGHPPFPTGSKQFSGHFGNLLFLAVFWVLNFWSRFEALNDIFWGMLRLQNSIMEFFKNFVVLG
jgi:hypothetical protein